MSDELTTAAWENFAEDAAAWVDLAGAELADIAAKHGVAVSRDYLEARLELLAGGLEGRFDIRPADAPRERTAVESLSSGTCKRGAAVEDAVDHERATVPLHPFAAGMVAASWGVSVDEVRARLELPLSPVAAVRVDGCDCDHCTAGDQVDDVDGPDPAPWFGATPGSAL